MQIMKNLQSAEERQSQAPLIAVEGLRNWLGENWVHDNLDFRAFPSEIIGIIGASGCGKTTLLRSILGLHSYTSGNISVFGVNLQTASEDAWRSVRRRWGVMFQSAGLFNGLTVLENIMFPLREFTALSVAQAKELAYVKLHLSGLSIEAGSKYPSELSGGMKKKAALARAIALDPELVFLDEPTAGLDPFSAGELDALLVKMRDLLGITFIIITHDLSTLWRITDLVAYLGLGKVIAQAPMMQLAQSEDPSIKSYFRGVRQQEMLSVYSRRKA